MFSTNKFAAYVSQVTSNREKQSSEGQGSGGSLAKRPESLSKIDHEASAKAK